MEDVMNTTLEGNEPEITFPDAADESAANQSAEDEGTASAAEDNGGGAESAEDETTGEDGKNDDGSGSAPEAQTGGGSEETFTLKVLGAEETVSRDEVIQLAQKGKDYDRVKGQVERYKGENDELRAFRDAHEKDIGELEAYMQETGAQNVGDVLDALRISAMVAKGVSREVAGERVKTQRLQRQLDERGRKDSAEEANRKKVQADLEEFRRTYPDVPVTKELMEKLKDDIAATGNLSSAYQRSENRRLAEELAQAKADLDAEKQNKSNHERSGGSQRADSGSKKTWLETFREGLMSDDD